MTNFSIIWTASVRETASASVMNGFPRLLLLQRSRRGAHPHQDVPGSPAPQGLRLKSRSVLQEGAAQYVNLLQDRRHLARSQGLRHPARDQNSRRKVSR